MARPAPLFQPMARPSVTHRANSGPSDRVRQLRSNPELLMLCAREHFYSEWGGETPALSATWLAMTEADREQYQWRVLASESAHDAPSGLREHAERDLRPLRFLQG